MYMYIHVCMYMHIIYTSMYVCMFFLCIDFGMAQHLTVDEVAESFRGSPLYMVIHHIDMLVRVKKHHLTFYKEW